MLIIVSSICVIFAILLVISIIQVITIKRNNLKMMKTSREIVTKNECIIGMLEQWILVKQQGKSIADYLKDHNYNSVAIYGMSYAGERLFYELKDSQVKVKYGIDRDMKQNHSDLEILSVEDEFPTVDAIIVTSMYYYTEIVSLLRKKVSYDILSLDELLYEV